MSSKLKNKRSQWKGGNNKTIKVKLETYKYLFDLRNKIDKQNSFDYRVSMDDAVQSLINKKPSKSGGKNV